MGQAVAKKKPKRRLSGLDKSRIARRNRPVTVAGWDMGSDGPAARAQRITETRGDINPETGEEVNPNGVAGSRRLTVAGLYYRRGLLTWRQFNAADTLRKAWEQKDRSPALYSGDKVDHSPKPDDRTAIIVDRQMEYVRMTRHVPRKYAPYVNHVARDDRHITAMPGYRRGVYMERLRAGLDLMADSIEGRR